MFFAEVIIRLDLVILIEIDVRQKLKIVITKNTTYNFVIMKLILPDEYTTAKLTLTTNWYWYERFIIVPVE